MKLSAAILCLWFTCLAGRGAPFVNLDFEMGNTNSSRIKLVHESFGRVFIYGTGPANDLLPGWKVFLGWQPEEETSVMAVGAGFFDALSPMPTHAALLPRADDSYIWRGLCCGTPDFEGAYALVLNNSRREEGTAVVSVKQDGLVPIDAVRIILLSPVFYSYFAMTIDEEMFPYSTFDRDRENPSRFSKDIAAWSGKTVTLGFWLYGDGTAVIDSIGFLVDVPLTITRNGGGSDEFGRVTITFPTTPDRNHFVEFRDALNTSAPWQPLPNGPHNSGSAVDTASESQRFYRVRMTYLP